MKTKITFVAACAAALAFAAPASAAPGDPGKAECDIMGVPASGGACIQWERRQEANGSAYTQNCRFLVENFFGGYPFTFYADGNGPFPPTTVKNQGQCKKTLKFFHSSFPGE